jgi:hypothetical protein
MIEDGNSLTIKVVVRRRTSTHLMFSALFAEKGMFERAANPGRITPLDHEFTCIHDEFLLPRHARRLRGCWTFGAPSLRGSHKPPATMHRRVKGVPSTATL